MWKRRLALSICAIGIVISVIFACKEFEQYPDTPQIEFKSLTFTKAYDEFNNPVRHGLLKFKVIDGDGDVGLRSRDTIGKYSKDSTYYYNLFLDIFKVEEGEREEIDLEVPHKFRVPYVEQKGQNNTIKATIEVEINYPLDKFNYDTVAYEFYFVDRALHKSDTADTGPIPVEDQNARQTD